MVGQAFGGLAGLRALVTLCMMLLAFTCGWVAGGGGQVEEIDGEVATLATAQEVEVIRSLIEAEKGLPPDEPIDAEVGPPAPRVPAESEIASATSLTKMDKKVGPTEEPDC